MSYHTLENESTSELLSKFLQGFGRMLNQEIELAKTELSQKASRLIVVGALLAVGAAVMFAGFLALIGFAVAAVSAVLPLWLSALLIGVVVVVIGAIMVMIGIRQLKKSDLKPQETIETLREGFRWMKNMV